MMNDSVLELFDGVRNVEFKGLLSVGAEPPVFTLKEPTKEEWNHKAQIQNTKMFVLIYNRQPKDYNEVLVWIDLKNEESRPAENEMTFV
jgi:hypothetical protein